MAGIYPGKEMCMTDIKTRDVVKGTIKTLDRAAITSERMKSAYTGIKGKGEKAAIEKKIFRQNMRLEGCATP